MIWSSPSITRAMTSAVAWPRRKSLAENAAMHGRRPLPGKRSIRVEADERRQDADLDRRPGLAGAAAWLASGVGSRAG
jgi:hypothetical protein